MTAPQKQPRRLLHTVTSTTRLLDLADNFKLDVDEVLGQGIAGFGLPGSGKTNAAALLAEEIGQHYIPMVVFDLEGDYLSLADILPRAIVATAEHCPTGKDVLSYGLQVVYDLSSWDDADSQAQLIMSVVNDLMDTARSLPNSERVPCLVFLDEAARWVPEYVSQAPGLSPEVYKPLRETFNTLASRGRKYGLTPALFSQRISQVAKSVLAPGMMFFMRQTLDTDIKRVMGYITPPGDLTPAQLKRYISRMATGKAFVRLSTGQKLVSFHKRQSEHVSHTPKSQAALNKFAAMPLPDAEFGAYGMGDEKAPVPVVVETPSPAPVVEKKSRKPVARKTAKKQPSHKTMDRKKARFHRLRRDNPTMSNRAIARELKVSSATVNAWVKALEA